MTALLFYYTIYLGASIAIMLILYKALDIVIDLFVDLIRQITQ
jgi:hypothetical protein